MTSENENNTLAGQGASVEYRDVEKRYGELQALVPTTLQIESGEFFSVIGPSGSGKTTLLAVTAGFIPPTAGQIIVDDHDVVGIPPFKRNIGMVFQNYSLFPHMDVAENIGFPLRMRKQPKAEIAKRVERLLDMVRLSGMGGRRTNQLSGGQQQRVALARAAIYDPLLLLMDEPLGALDKNLREEMQDEIKQFQNALGTTVIYVTHDQHEAASMSHRIAIMNGGRIEQVGTSRDLYEYPRNRFVASFLGEANLFEVTDHEPGPSGGTIVRSVHDFRFRLVDTPPGDGNFVVCVRPENIQLSAESTDADNSLSGTVIDVVYAAGTIRYRIEVHPDFALTQRLPAELYMNLFDVGETVHLSWSAGNTRLIGEG